MILVKHATTQRRNLKGIFKVDTPTMRWATHATLQRGSLDGKFENKTPKVKDMLDELPKQKGRGYYQDTHGSELHTGLRAILKGTCFLRRQGFEAGTARRYALKGP